MREGSAVMKAFAVAVVVIAPGCSSNARPTRAEGQSGGAVELIRNAARPVEGRSTDYDSLMRVIGGARLVLLGESTHGTHEFYRERARITQRLIGEKGFSAVAIEGDWPDAYRVNRYIRGLGNDASAEAALSSFRRFPAWMWRNEEVRDLVKWMRTWNEGKAPADQVGFYGIDVYSLFEAGDELVRYLGEVDPTASARVSTLYSCFEKYRPDPSLYGSATQSGVTCEKEAAEALTMMTRREASRPADPLAAEALFSARRNAHSVANAERYFRTAYLGLMNTWNLRDQEMVDNLAALEEHLRVASGREAKIVVWAHNTHTGDARVTQAGEEGEHNVGQLMRERHGDRAVLIGFHTYTGTVLAATAWGETGQVRELRPAIADSYEALFHAAGVPNFSLILRGPSELSKELGEERLQRAVGVVYLPVTERHSHYFTARLSKQFDASVFFDTTRAVTPLPCAACAP